MPVLFHAALADGAMAAAEGRNLSPIEIISQNAVPTKFPELKFWGYDSNVPLVLHNDGHSGTYQLIVYHLFSILHMHHFIYV